LTDKCTTPPTTAGSGQRAAAIGLGMASSDRDKQTVLAMR
jgi:formyltetrahydrofolate synthetase